MRRALKWIGIVLAVLLGLAALLFAAGFLLPGDFAYETAAEINAPPEKIFSYLDSQEGLKAWWGSTAEEAKAAGYPPMELVAPAGPASGKGMRFEFRVEGVTAETWEVLESEPPRRIVYEIDFQILKVRRTLTLEPVDADTTRVRWAESGTSQNPLLRWGALIEGDSIVSNFDRALGAVKKLAEAR
jgi:uncharacterized protein YndB with AHSA1/START domain